MPKTNKKRKSGALTVSEPVQPKRRRGMEQVPSDVNGSPRQRRNTSTFDPEDGTQMKCLTGGSSNRKKGRGKGPGPSDARSSKRDPCHRKITHAKGRKGSKANESGASHVIDINIHSITDTAKCYITSSAIISGDKLVLADFHNDKLKLVSTTTKKVLSEIRMCDAGEKRQKLIGPWDMTTMSDTEVAVTLPNRNLIAIVKLEGSTLTVTKTIPVQGICRGIFFVDETFITTFDEPVKLETINAKGDVLKSVKLAPDEFSFPAFIDQIPNEQLFFVSDVGLGQVTIVDKEGVVQARHSPEFYAKNMCIGPDGCAYIVNGNRLHTMTPDFAKGVIVLSKSHGLWEPISVAWSEQTNEVYVGQEGEYLKVFRL